MPGKDAEATTIEDQPRQVRAWYGLPGEIVVESGHWHLVKVGPLPLPHPPVINRLIRRGLPREEKLRLSYWHELGHLQTLPLALAHAVWLWHGRSRRPRPWMGRLIRLAAALVAHEAAWELASETYVVTKSGPRYRRLHRKYPNPLRPAFWVGMAGLALVGTVFFVRKQSQGQ
ncbi:MAG: hypothetical protein A2Z31_07505 [candidate division NC10 bacterium RBG_16_65_8]|nr:MAG: hypothetical protein A2Z31_07505 [candidate division NC10 bacterium RBG_16_65_8]